MDPTKLDPEVKWRSMVSLLLNYFINVQKILTKKFGEKTAEEIQNLIINEFCGEQVQAFIELFALNPESVIDAQSLKRTMATLFDIKYESISENKDEIIDKMEYKYCTIRATLEPISDEFCKNCEKIGQIFISKIDPNLKHETSIKDDTCFQKTIRRK
ncbi:MAG: hypothetical protein ACFFD2_16190 [Promethearchaeota archaeon]